MRSLIKGVLLLGLPLLAGTAVLIWYANAQRYVSTDNAYVKSNLVAVSAAIDGQVTDVRVGDNESVRRGQTLFFIDRRPYEIALRRAQADLAAVGNDIRSMKAQYAQSRAEVTDAKQRAAFVARQRDREHRLSKRGMSTDAKLDAVQYDMTQASQRVRALEQRARRTLAELGGKVDSPLETHARYQGAIAVRDRAALSLEYTEVRAPSDGTVSRMKLQRGEWIEAGKTVFTLVEQGALWVEANVKETQLTFVRERQKVQLRVDAYPDLSWAGQVQTISSATGSEFLVLPAQNATGNWVKVVQRLPVRIGFSAGGLDRGILRSGMTVSISIDTERETQWTALLRDASASLGLSWSNGH
ncbi:MAG: membrane fusion protein (multidrug efflux system) [Gammaproteobacteria bacterium]|jgi:membrane fusion protein (multidrug efflux system)